MSIGQSKKLQGSFGWRGSLDLRHGVGQMIAQVADGDMASFLVIGKVEPHRHPADPLATETWAGMKTRSPPRSRTSLPEATPRSDPDGPKAPMAVRQGSTPTSDSGPSGRPLAELRGTTNDGLRHRWRLYPNHLEVDGRWWHLSPATTVGFDCREPMVRPRTGTGHGEGHERELRPAFHGLPMARGTYLRPGVGAGRSQALGSP